jgi:LPXTG-motif cell wall-anchored protein
MQEDIRDHLDAMTLPASGLSAGTIAIGAIVLLLVIVVVALWFLRRRKLHIGTPEEHARRCLAAIYTSDCRLFHAQLASVLVEYFEMKLGLRSSRLTSGEILTEFRRNGVMSAEWQAALEQLFAECDQAKFSGGAPVWDAANSIERAQRLLDDLAAQIATMPALSAPWKGWSDAAI